MFRHSRPMNSLSHRSSDGSRSVQCRAVSGSVTAGYPPAGRMPVRGGSLSAVADMSSGRGREEPCEEAATGEAGTGARAESGAGGAQKKRSSTLITSPGRTTSVIDAGRSRLVASEARMMTNFSFFAR